MVATPSLFADDDFFTYGEMSDLDTREQTDFDHTEAETNDVYINRMQLSGSCEFTHKELTLRKTAIDFDDLSFADDLIYHRPWVTSKIDFGLITEQDSESIVIWNANENKYISVTDLDDPGHSGISIETFTPTVYIPPFGIETYDVTVFLSGPAEQNTTYTWTIDSNEFESLISGTRLVIIPYEIDWQYGYKIIYRYYAAIWNAKTLHEQRRSLNDRVFRKIQVTYVLSEDEAFKFLNLIKFSRGRFCLIPCYDELIEFSATPSSTIIATSTDLTYHWDLQNHTEYIILINPLTGETEAKEITTVSTNSIAVSIAVEGDFPYSYCYAYPAIIGYIENFDSSYVTRNLVKINMSYSEVVINAG